MKDMVFCSGLCKCSGFLGKWIGGLLGWCTQFESFIDGKLFWCVLKWLSRMCL